ncbi:MAG: c-type cytochrome [Actinomycetota bacterium]|nr:c-type cytochrome [Actinomycetota bacterium]
MSVTVVVISVLAFTAVAVILLLLANAARGRRALQDVPPALRPGYSDEELERRVIERYMGWGVVLTTFFAIFLPAYWLREPSRLTGQTNAAYVANYERGEELFVANCAMCHGAKAEGGGAPSTYDPDDSWPAPNLTTIDKRYEDSPVTDIRDYLATTIQRGRPGTPMPAWGAEYGGPMTDQQISDITDWILANQKTEVTEADPAANMSGEQLYQQNCVRCHGRELEGFIGPSLVGVFKRHNEETVLGILRNGIYLANGVSMPPWQQAYMYEDARYTDEALERIVDYLKSQQPADLPEDAGQYRTPYGDGGPAGAGGGADQTAPEEDPNAGASEPATDA